MTAEEITNKSEQVRAKQAKLERGPRSLVRGVLLILLLLAAVLGYATNVGGLEIVHGVAPDDRVIVNPSDLITTGQPVPVQQADRTGVKS